MTAWAIVTSPVWVPLVVMIVGGTVKLIKGNEWGGCDMTCPKNGPMTGLLWALPLSIALWSLIIWVIYHVIAEGLK